MKKYILLIAAAFLFLGAAVPSKQVKVSPAGTVMVDPSAANLRTALSIAATPPLTLGFSATNGGVALLTGKRKGYATCTVTGTISAWSIAVNTGTATVKVWKIATGTAVPTISNVINTSGVAISSGTYVRSTTVTDFTSTAVAAGDIFAFDLTAISSVTEMSFTVEVTPAP